MSLITATEILARFLEEQASIRTFVVTTNELTRLDDKFVAHVTFLLSGNGIKRFFQRPKVRRDKPFDQSELTTLLNAVDQVEPKVREIIAQRDVDLDKHETDDSATAIPDEHYQYFVDWINYIAENLSDRPNDEERDALLERAFREHINAIEDRDPDEDPDEADQHRKAVIRHAIKQVEYERLCEKTNWLRQALIHFERMRFAARLQAPGAEVNIFRQGFLLLMTAFDAAAFDITRAALREHFFRIIASLGKKETIPLKQWSDFKSHEDFRDQCIEHQLKSFYLKELLSALRRSGVPYTTDEAEIIHVTEMIQRRNVHVHNRGIVDERYLERDERGAPKYNIFNYRLGEIAAIDTPYWERANKLTAECVRNLAAWVAAGSPTTTT